LVCACASVYMSVRALWCGCVSLGRLQAELDDLQRQRDEEARARVHTCTRMPARTHAHAQARALEAERAEREGDTQARSRSACGTAAQKRALNGRVTAI
jgi:hypothetical protein